MAGILWSAPATIEISLADEEKRKLKTVVRDNQTSKLPIYFGSETVKGTTRVVLKPGKKIEHAGVRAEFIGQIELFYDRGNHHQFTTVTPLELAPAGILTESAQYDFEFDKPDKPHESYNGTNARLRYFVRVTVQKSSFSSNVLLERDIWVHNYQKAPEVNKPIKMEVGIEECLHIEFEYNRSKYHLKDVIIGKIYFILVRIMVRHMEIAIIRRESTGTAPNVYNESEPITKFEIMDGAPVRGESIPIRLFLAPFQLTPTYRNVQSKFSVKYYLNLVLVDEDDRRYYKQQEIALWRKRPEKGGRSKSRTTGGKKSYQQYERDVNNPARAPDAADAEANIPTQPSEPAVASTSATTIETAVSPATPVVTPEATS